MAVVELAGIVLYLPDGKIIFQRRDAKAPTDPNKLCFLGGHMEEGETSLQAAQRELGEETSLDIPNLPLDPLGDLFIPMSVSGWASDRLAHLFKASVPAMDFEVYEGSGVEAYSIEEILARDDVIAPVKTAEALLRKGL